MSHDALPAKMTAILKAVLTAGFYPRVAKVKLL